MDVTVEPLTSPPDAVVELPGSKSLTNRALLAAALAEGTSTLTRVLAADDSDAMLDCIAALGAGVEHDRAAATARITGVGGVLAPGPLRLDARQSGTVSRFLLPLLATGAGPYLLDGAEQLRARPFGPLFDALGQLGVAVTGRSETGQDLPVEVAGGGAQAVPEVAISGDESSQFLSGLLFAAPLLPGGLRIRLTTELVSRPYVVMTAAVLAAFGVAAEVGEDVIDVRPQRYRATAYDVEPDASAASYFVAAAAATGGRVRIPGLHRGSLQGDVAFVDIVERMGAKVTWEPDAVVVQGTGRLRGLDVDMEAVSDTAPTMAVLAALADSPTTLNGIGFIRRKESDRIAGPVRELRRCGIEAEELPDGLRVVPGPVHPARIETYDDHRMAMSFALLGLRHPGITITGAECVAKTFPAYFEALAALSSAA